ncbi:Cdc37 N terminal kinase binding-domain-containing protein [Staphylotrichum tortipilum]|uniref:Hsp90 chaperone protein kinase-targeting subunit n=1 Tax=Staphylotrichum tortipilum TaxID=2831512 RepID=A0AAN6RLZ1_9PEZI|nr:Cdc37 N terminal kinase binding-domain-containing protein [Staphylotrichum longicolle]
MVDYSKWDALELSDDSDVEVHPNVDKRSFIRAKQNQIHMERQQRKLQIEAYKHQRIVNEALAQRLSLLVSAVQSSIQDADANPFDTAFKAMMELALRNPEDDIPPPRPDGLSDPDSPPLPQYSNMVAAVLDEVSKALGQRRVEDRTLRLEAFVEELRVHIQNIQDAQADLIKKLEELEQQSSKKITSDSYHVGFDTSHIRKPDPAEKKLASSSLSSSDTKVELLNPNLHFPEGGLATGSGTAGSDSDKEEEEPARASPLAKRFAQIPRSDYRASYEFVVSHPEMLHEPKEEDGLLFEACTILLNDGDQARERAQQCIHQALLLQYCRLLGRDGVALFFKRMATPEHQGREVFEKELAEMFQRILDIAQRDAKKRQDSAETGKLVERVQLCSLADGEGSVRIVVPMAQSKDEEVQRARSIFESFSPEMRAALETGSLDEVNKVLGEMEASEAENLASLLTESGCMSIEDEIIDATTEDGKKFLEMRRSTSAKDSVKPKGSQQVRVVQVVTRLPDSVLQLRQAGSV